MFVSVFMINCAVYIEAESTFFLFADVVRSALAQSAPGAVGLSLLTALVSWVRIYLTLSKSPAWLEEDTIVTQTNALAEILGTMQTYVAFLLVFMLLNRLTWFFSVLGVTFLQLQYHFSNQSGLSIASTPERFFSHTNFYQS